MLLYMLSGWHAEFSVKSMTLVTEVDNCQIEQVRRPKGQTGVGQRHQYGPYGVS